MLQLEKMPLIWFLLNILKPNFAICDWICADESHILLIRNEVGRSTDCNSTTWHNNSSLTDKNTIQ